MAGDAGSALLGFSLVIVATGFVLVEGSITHRQLDSDVPDLAHSTGQVAAPSPRRPGIGSVPAA